MSAAVVVLVVLLLWPGPIGWTGPILCASDRPDAFVVRGTEKLADGAEVATFTLVCVGAGGDYRDAGAVVPFTILVLGSAATTTLLRAVLHRTRGRRPSLA